MKRLLSNYHCRLFFLLAVLTLAASGCSTVDKEPDNSSVRPWNSPQGWEGGMPGGNQYR